ncbi:MAG: heparinase II/III family protein [Ignavibacteriae bacterium]|nr:heparinase II/III family protein [Ignavibacteriota bacterium]
MKPTRREFLLSSVIAAAGLYAGVANADATPASEDARWKRKSLLFDDSDVPRILKTVQHPRFASHWNSMTEVDFIADLKFLKEELRLNNHTKDMLRARLILERSAFVYKLTKDRRHLDLARVAIDRILEYKRWDYFLEAGEHTIALQRASEATIAMSYAREWLNNELSVATKEEMEKQIGEKGAAACYQTLFGMMHPDRVRGWSFDPEDDYPHKVDVKRWPFILNSTNLKVIPIAGLAVGGCLLYDKHPQAKRWVNMALQSAKAFSSIFGADGSYEEGAGYWGYTAQHLTIFVEALRRTLGMNERNLINFPGTSRFALRMSMPAIGHLDDCVNFGDAWYMGDVSVALWTAREFKDPIAQYVGMSVGEIRSHYPLVWYDPSVKAKTPGPELYDARFDNDWVVVRSGWGVMDSVVAMRSGAPANHEHADRNSVIFKAYGDRLLHDPLHAAYPYTEPHWVLRLTESHTAVLINGKGHQYHDGHEGTNASWAEARIEGYVKQKNYVAVTSDASEAYRLVNADVDAVYRTLIFLKPDVLVFFDRVRMKESNADVQIRFQGYNEDHDCTLQSGKSDFVINRPHASLKAKVMGLKEIVIRTDTLKVPEANGVHPFVEVKSDGAQEHLVLTVCTAQQATKQHGDLSIQRNDNEWKITGTHNGLSVNIRLVSDKDIPTIAVG